MLNEEKEMYEAAFKARNSRLLRELDRGLTGEINDYPPEYRREINRRIEAEDGIDAEEVEKKRLKN